MFFICKLMFLTSMLLTNNALVNSKLKKICIHTCSNNNNNWIYSKCLISVPKSISMSTLSLQMSYYHSMTSIFPWIAECVGHTSEH